MDQLTNQLKEARLLAEDADGKSDEVSRKLAFVEDELEVAEDRVKSGEAKIMELEEELKVVGNSLKSLEVSEEKANQRVEEFKRQLKTLTVKLKEAEARAEFAEKTVTATRMLYYMYNTAVNSITPTNKALLFSTQNDVTDMSRSASPEMSQLCTRHVILRKQNYKKRLLIFVIISTLT